uniref:UDP-N-acetylmuramoylalanine--D-glutamate ligase n=1 Tax=candidate division WOR-3 bacterium TaxID=2052148 RepID=A0A7C4TCD6_UNCW3
MKVLLLGLGRANLKVAEYLIKKGEEVYCYEERMESLSESAKEILRQGKIKVFADIDYELVIASPGFPPQKEIIKKLKSKNTLIIDEIEWTFQTLKEPKVIAVTGTNGKSTTAALVSQILKSAGIKNFLGGNIAPGKPFSEALFEEEKEYYVLEVSSFQLTRIKKFRPYIGVLTNISLDHLNWHQNFEEYIKAKKNLFVNQSSTDYAVLNFEDRIVRGIGREVRSQVVFFGKRAKDGVWLNGEFHFQDEVIFEDKNIPLLGQHNRLNIMAGIGVAKILGINNKKIEEGVKSFKPLKHRLEDLGVINGVRYINNSMCTNEVSAIESFKAVEGDKIIIVGGREKGDNLENYLKLLIHSAKACVILGENAEFIAQYFKQHKFFKYKIAKNMKEAVNFAREFAKNGDVIMLNPGFASFGIFRDFLERGEAFKDAVKH